VSDYDRRAGCHRGEPSRRRHAEACSSEEMKQQLDLEKLECNMDLGGVDIPPPVLDLMEGGGDFTGNVPQDARPSDAIVIVPSASLNLASQ
jgi:hypothetical protein